jgi:hypothetical protein
VARSTLADANEAHDWRIFADFAQVLIGIARPLYVRRSDRRRSGSEPVCAGFDHHRSVPFAVSVGQVPQGKAAVKMHTLLDLHGNIPTFISITDGKVHDVNILDEICRRPEPSTSWTAATSISSVSSLHAQSAFFVVRTKGERPAPAPLLASGGQEHGRALRSHGHSDCHRLGLGLPGCAAPRQLSSMETGKRLKFLTNNFTLPALTIARSTSSAGRWNCSSNGSSSTCESRPSTAPARTP